MDQTAALVLLGLFLVALVLAALELQASLQPARCPECEHCRTRRVAERSARERAWREFRADNEPPDHDTFTRR